MPNDFLALKLAIALSSRQRLPGQTFAAEGEGAAQMSEIRNFNRRLEKIHFDREPRVLHFGVS